MQLLLIITRRVRLATQRLFEDEQEGKTPRVYFQTWNTDVTGMFTKSIEEWHGQF